MRGTPAKKPLFLPSRLLIMHATIAQLLMSSCQIRQILAVMHIFLAHFLHCFSFVFLKQESLSENSYYIKVQMRSSIEGRELQRHVLSYIKSSIKLMYSSRC